MDRFDKEYLWRFLLLELDEGERESLASRLVEQPDVYDQLREAEDDLIDALARDELGPERRAAAERFVRESGQMERLSMARLLSAAPASKRRSASAGGGWMVLSLLATAASVVMGVFWFNAAGERDAMASRLAAVPPVAANTSRGGAVLAVMLAESTVRGAAPASLLAIDTQTQVVALDLAASLPAGVQTWQASVLDSSGSVIHEQSGRINVRDAAVEQKLSLLMPASALRPGAYSVEVRLNEGTAPELVFRFEVAGGALQPAR